MLIEQMLVRIRQDLDMAKKAKERRYTDAFWLAIDNAEATLKVLASLMDRASHLKYLETESYRKREKEPAIEKSRISDNIYLVAFVDTIRTLIYRLQGWLYVGCDLYDEICRKRRFGREPYIRKKRPKR